MSCDVVYITHIIFIYYYTCGHTYMYVHMCKLLHSCTTSCVTKKILKSDLVFPLVLIFRGAYTHTTGTLFIQAQSHVLYLVQSHSPHSPPPPHCSPPHSPRLFLLALLLLPLSSFSSPSSPPFPPPGPSPPFTCQSAARSTTQSHELTRKTPSAPGGCRRTHCCTSGSM